MGCSHGASGSGTASSSPSASSQATAGGTPDTSPPVAASTSPEASASPTPDPNLLSYQNGAVVRSYTSALDGSPNDFAGDGANVPDGVKQMSVVWELPGVADLTQAHVELDATEAGKAPENVSIAASTTGPSTGFTDLASVKAAPEATPHDLPLQGKARWIRLTIDRGDAPRPFTGLRVTGTLEPRPAGAPIPTQLVVLDGSPYKDGAFIGKPSNDPWYVRTAQAGSSFTAVRCADEKYADQTLGTLDGRTWTIADERHSGRAAINDEGTMIVGSDGSAFHYVATTTTPAYCAPRTIGNGKRNILILDAVSPARQFSLDDEKEAKPYHITRINATTLTPELLAKHDTLVFNMVCVSSEYLTTQQTDAVNRWVSAGHVAIIWDSDSCGATTNYSFLPYPFKTNNPGAAGAAGKRLIEVESNALGSLDRNDVAHYFDAKAYAANENNQIGDANTTVTKDDHWCGHLFGTNSNNVNGFMQMYAPYGQGFFVFDGFDHDDSDIAEHRRMRTLELMLATPADLPCRVKASQSFVIEPDREGTFVAGTATTLPFDMEVLANQGWKGHVTLTASGNFPASVSPSAFDMSGGTQPLKIAVTVPKTAKPGQYAITVVASDGAATSQAVIQLNATAPPKVIFKQKRIRLYGIHFDYDSAHIQPRSEPVIKQIADIMNQDRSLRFEVEGHTDGDGGAAYNLALSQKRAESVVNDLVRRYHIARSRLIPKGYGLSKPVAPNTTEGGKALNRRVELVRL